MKKAANLSKATVKNTTWWTEYSLLNIIPSQVNNNIYKYNIIFVIVSHVIVI